MELANSMDYYVSLIYLAFGVYLVWVFFSERGNKGLPANKMLYMRNCEPAKCKDPAAYKHDIMPKLLILGILLIVFAALIVTINVIALNSVVVEVLLTVLPLGVLVWYYMALRAAAVKYW